jgi:hypothetical protein
LRRLRYQGDFVNAGIGNDGKKWLA